LRETSVPVRDRCMFLARKRRIQTRGTVEMEFVDCRGTASELGL